MYTYFFTVLYCVIRSSRVCRLRLTHCYHLFIALLGELHLDSDRIHLVHPRLVLYHTHLDIRVLHPCCADSPPYIHTLLSFPKFSPFNTDRATAGCIGWGTYLGCQNLILYWTIVTWVLIVGWGRGVVGSVGCWGMVGMVVWLVVIGRSGEVEGGGVVNTSIWPLKVFIVGGIVPILRIKP